MEDAQIIDLYFRREEEVLCIVEKKYGSYCRAIARRILTDTRDAEEVVNDTWLDSWNAIPPHRPRILSAFLGAITRRRALDRYDLLTAEKRGGGQLDVALEELDACIPGKDMEHVLEQAELAAIINTFLRETPDIQRKIFILRYWYLESIEDISKKFGFSPSKVKSMLHRTRQKLRKKLEKEDMAL